MKQLIKILSVSICIFLLLFASCSVAFASAYNFNLDCSKPSVDNNSGYLELFWQRDSDGFIYAEVWSWTFTPTDNSSNQDLMPYTNQLLVNLRLTPAGVTFTFAPNDFVTGYFCRTQIDSTGRYNIAARPLNYDSPYSWTHNMSGYTLKSAHVYGNISAIDNQLGNYPDSFTVTYAEDALISSQLGGLMTVLLSFADLYDENSAEYKDRLYDIIDSLNSFSGSFDDFSDFYSTQMKQLFVYLSESVNHLLDISKSSEGILENTTAILEYFSIIEGWLIDIWTTDQYILTELYDIKKILSEIKNILNSKSDTEFTTQDPTQFDNYYDVENSLLNNDNVNVDDVVKVEVNQNALSVIWDYVERGLNSHGKVFGMVLTILALGIIALILGR